MTSQSGVSLDQITELFEKIQRMVVAIKHPREIQYRLREDVSMRGEQRRHARQEEIEMALINRSPRQRELITSRWPYTPRGKL